MADKKVFLYTYANGERSKEDVTQEFKDSGCQTIDEFCEKNKADLISQAIETTGFEWWVKEGNQDEQEY